MRQIYDGGPAFPTREKIGSEADEHGDWHDIFGDFGGMTLRDYFAAKAMQSLMRNVADWKYLPEGIAEYSYKQADAMLKAREGK